MKKIVAFVMVLALGMFCAVGCGENKDKGKKDDKGKGAAASTDKGAPDAGAKKGEEPKK